MVAIKLQGMRKRETDNGRFPYHAYLIRLWASEGEDAASWRARLENILAPNDVHTFADLDTLFCFLQTLPTRNEDLRRLNFTDSNSANEQEEH